MQRGRRRLAVVLACALLAAWGGVAQGAGRGVPAGLDATVPTAHFLIHYSPATATADYAAAGAADFEEAYSRLVAGAGGSPSAGLRPPVTTSSGGRTDVYLSAPAALPTFTGGLTGADPDGTGYVFMTPGMSRSAFRFRAAHEFMHVLEYAYSPPPPGLLVEALANWAAEHALPDVDPLDNNMANPWLPLDCSSGTWPASGGAACGDGYWQWGFVRWLTERHGTGFVADMLAAHDSGNDATVKDWELLDERIAVASGGASNLSRSYAQYARDVWDPTRWTTTAIAGMRGISTWAATRLGRTDAAGGDTAVAVDHLATRYVVVQNWGDDQASGPGDALEVTVAGAPWTRWGWRALTRERGGTAWADGPEVPESGGTFTLPFDPAHTREVVLPLTNDFTQASPFSPIDGRVLTYRVRLVRGTPTPPANDTRAGALAAGLGVSASDVVYAGGHGAAEAAGCPAAAGATEGVWFRFAAPMSDAYFFDADQSDFAAVVAVFDAGSGAFRGCTRRGRLGVQMAAGTSALVYVGRQASNGAGDGTQARLAVTGPAAPVQAVAPKVVVARHTLRLDRRRRVPVRVSCVIGTAQGCRGLVRLRTVRMRLAGSRRPRALLLGTARFSMVAGQTRNVTVPVGRAALRLLRPRRSVRVVAQVLMRLDGAMDSSVVASRTLVLRLR